MIPYKQLSLADIFTNCQNKFNNNKYKLSIDFDEIIPVSRQRRNYSTEFKSDLVIELLKGEKYHNTRTTEKISEPICTAIGKKLLNNASTVFDDDSYEISVFVCR